LAPIRLKNVRIFELYIVSCVIQFVDQKKVVAMVMDWHGCSGGGPIYM